MWEATNTPLLPRVESANRSTCLSPSLGCSAASLVSWESEMKHCSSGRGKLYNDRSLQWEEPETSGTRKDIAHPHCQNHLLPAATFGFVALGTSLPPAIPVVPGTFGHGSQHRVSCLCFPSKPTRCHRSVCYSEGS